MCEHRWIREQDFAKYLIWWCLNPRLFSFENHKNMLLLFISYLVYCILLFWITCNSVEYKLFHVIVVFIYLYDVMIHDMLLVFITYHFAIRYCLLNEFIILNCFHSVYVYFTLDFSSHVKDVQVATNNAFVPIFVSSTCYKGTTSWNKGPEMEFLYHKAYT